MSLTGRDSDLLRDKVHYLRIRWWCGNQSSNKCRSIEINLISNYYYIGCESWNNLRLSLIRLRKDWRTDWRSRRATQKLTRRDIYGFIRLNYILQVEGEYNVETNKQECVFIKIFTIRGRIHFAESHNAQWGVEPGPVSDNDRHIQRLLRVSASCCVEMELLWAILLHFTVFYFRN